MDTAEAAVADAANVLRGLPIQLESHAGFSEVLASLARGESGTLGGVWGSSRALVAAALARLEVLAVAAVIETDTTAHATHILPCAGQLERADVPLAGQGAIHEHVEPAELFLNVGM